MANNVYAPVHDISTKTPEDGIAYERDRSWLTIFAFSSPFGGLTPKSETRAIATRLPACGTY